MKTGLGLKKKALNMLNVPLQAGKQKIFCISMQRNGTTSVGRFLKDHGYRVASYGQHSKDWSALWYKGDYERIFNSIAFKSHQAFEDNPWWYPDFYRVLQCRFPGAKFILFYRNSNKWFDSMLNHPIVPTLINNYGHSKIYRKLDLFYDKLDNDPTFQPDKYDAHNLLPFEEMRSHYIKVYNEYNRDVIEYFKNYAPHKLFVSKLENDEKWRKLGEFLKFNVQENYEVHVNKSPQRN
jgi:hypothetical protein